jgi:hypothetical protein
MESCRDLEQAGFAVPELVRPRSGERGFHLDWLTTRDPLDGDLCDAIVRICQAFPTEPPTVVGGAPYAARRQGDIRRIGATAASLPLLGLLAAIADAANAQAFGLDVTAIGRTPHYVEYVPGRGRFDWHNDYSHAVAAAPRKLTLIIQLSDSREYAGGRLQMFGTEIETLPDARGAVMVFPSIFYHRVTPVTRGCRRALVCWIAGPRLR